MSETCKYKWNAPKLFQSGKVESVEQVCILTKGHKGFHRSLHAIIKPVKEK